MKKKILLKGSSAELDLIIYTANCIFLAHDFSFQIVPLLREIENKNVTWPSRHSVLPSWPFFFPAFSCLHCKPRPLFFVPLASWCVTSLQQQRSTFCTGQATEVTTPNKLYDSNMGSPERNSTPAFACTFHRFDLILCRNDCRSVIYALCFFFLQHPSPILLRSLFIPHISAFLSPA